MLLLPVTLKAESKRIYVYPVSQAYYDVKAGDTLGQIVQYILPNNRRMHTRLMRDILDLNPNAFINGNPDRLKAYVRLWLPNHAIHTAKQTNRSNFTVREYSWGYIKTPK